MRVWHDALRREFHGTECRATLKAAYTYLVRPVRYQARSRATHLRGSTRRPVHLAPAQQMKMQVWY